MSSAVPPEAVRGEVLRGEVVLGEGPVRDADGADRRHTGTGPEVGQFRQGDPASRWALARYLVARTVGDGVVTAVAAIAVVFVALTVVLAVVGAPVVLSVLVGLVAFGWVVGWWIARALWRRLTAGPALAPVRHDLDQLARDTRGDVRRELRRLDLPAHPAAAFSLAARLAGRRRADTLERLRGFDVDRVVPPARVDQAYLLFERLDTGRVVSR